MSATSTLLAVAIGLALLWTTGGLALRLGGALAFWAGLVGLLVSGGAVGLLVAVLGALAWVAGQAHHALRHGGARGSIGAGVLGLIGRDRGR